MDMAPYGFQAYIPIGYRQKTVDPDMFIERLKKLRALDPNLSKFDKDGHIVRHLMTVFLKKK